VETRWTLLRDEQGLPQKILSISHDITKQKKLEQQLHRAERLQTIGTLSSGVAHDLNNIFAPFLVGLPILREEIRTRETRDMLDLMENSIHRGAEIVRQLLLFGRGGDSKRLPINPAKPLHEVIKIIRGTFPKNITLKIAHADDLWTVLGDSTQIYQVLLNLAINARDALPQGGTIFLTAENKTLAAEEIRNLSPTAIPGQYVIFSVRDNGIGMTSEILQRIYEPFFTTKEIGKGTGLGLSMVIGVVQNHGGFIQVQSTPGQGSEFKIHLPALPAVSERTETPAASPAKSPGRNELILIVDDESAILRVTEKILERNGYRPLLAHSGNEAINLFVQNQHHINLVITDYSMPGMNGGALAEAIRKIQPDIPVIVASGLGDALDADKLKQIGVEIILRKPFDTPQLLTVLQKIFRPAVTPD
jgi:two-component system, cell cycle sensor histidine kinase and response regulator CckA